VLYARVPRLFADLELAHGDGRFTHLFRTLVKAAGGFFCGWPSLGFCLLALSLRMDGVGESRVTDDISGLLLPAWWTSAPAPHWSRSIGTAGRDPSE
jgi:hypothetical protein